MRQIKKSKYVLDRLSGNDQFHGDIKNINKRLESKDRLCLKCSEMFESEGKHNRFCVPCGYDRINNNDTIEPLHFIDNYNFGDEILSASLLH